MIKLQLGPWKEEIEFLVDSGAEKSTVMKIPKGRSIGKTTSEIIGAKGEAFKVHTLKDVEIESETKIVVNDLLLVPEAEYNLLGRDLMLQLRIGLTPTEDKLQVRLFPLNVEDETRITSEVWATPDKMGKLEITPITVKILGPEIPIRIKQYPLPLEGRRGLKPIIDNLLRQGTLEPCMSPHNTPILPVKKGDGSYRLVQDLRAVNQRTLTRFPVVANPYTLLNQVPPAYQWYSVIDLKDAFWACSLSKESRDYFAFEWEDPETGRKQQLRWTVLPQGFTESPNLFGQALEDLLLNFITEPGVKLVQYVDDLLIAGEDQEKVRNTTIDLLNFLGSKGLKVSKPKLQFVEREVKYLGHWLSKGKKKLDPERITGILNLRPPRTKREIRQLLGLLGYCRQWIEGYSKNIKFLYEKLTNDVFKWTIEDDEQLDKIKQKLIQAPVLSLPDLGRPFYLFVNVEDQTAYGVLTQDWGGDKKPVGYYSKMLDPVSRGWPICLQAVVATAVLIEEARKVTFGAALTVFTPHDVRGILHQKAEKWLTDSRILKYEAILINSPELQLKTTTAKNPAEFLYRNCEERGLVHDCIELIDLQTKIRPDLEEVELLEGERYFVDGSSRVQEGKRMSGYAIIDGRTMRV